MCWYEYTSPHIKQYFLQSAKIGFNKQPLKTPQKMWIYQIWDGTKEGMKRADTYTKSIHGKKKKVENFVIR